MSKKDWWSEEFKVMVALGESTTAGGWSSSPERCWVAVLGSTISDVQQNPVKTVNSGIGANLISTRSPHYAQSGKPAASERLEKHVFAHGPDLVLVSYGLNDTRGGYAVAPFIDDLRDVVQKIRNATSALIVLLGPYFILDYNRGREEFRAGTPAAFAQVNAAIKELATGEDCLFVDVLEAQGSADWMIHFDGVHSNDIGHRVIANRVFEVLAQNCSGLARHTKELERQSPRWRDESVLRADYGYVKLEEGGLTLKIEEVAGKGTPTDA